MLKLTLRNIERDGDDNETVEIKNYAAEGTVELAMDSIWGYAGKRVVNIEGVRVINTTYDDGCESTMVNVTHDTTWDIYTDTGFEAAISKALGYDVGFTEQGMQDDGYASMET